jgi:hypothetical protein
MVLVLVLMWVVPVMPAVWPGGLRVFLAWFVIAGGSALVSLVLVRIPVLSRLVGRSGPPLRRKIVAHTGGEAEMAHQQTMVEEHASRKSVALPG